MHCAIHSSLSVVSNTFSIRRGVYEQFSGPSIHLHYAGRCSEIAICCQTGYKKEVERAAAEKALRMTAARNYRLQWHA
jgi:hypothetical protein